MEGLTLEERASVEAALEKQQESTNPKWRVGAAAISYDGVFAAIHNDEVGPTAHAEQRVLTELYKAGGRRIKILAIAGARKGERVIQDVPPYVDGVRFRDIQWMCPCGKCLECIHDCTADVEDVTILSVAVTGQVMRTSLRSMVPVLHTSFRVPIMFGGDTVYPVSSTHDNRMDGNEFDPAILARWPEVVKNLQPSL